jgi:hypothetical protein
METNNIKTLTITGSAAANPLSLEQGKKPPRRSVSRRKQVEEVTEESESIDSNVQMPIAKPIPLIKYNITKTVSTIPKPIPTQPPVNPVVAATSPAAVAPAVSPVLNQKVILKPPSPRVKLLNTASQHNGGHRTKVTTRKIRRVNIPNLNRKFTRAHKTSLETKETPLDSIRTFLVGKGVIQEKSKAPEKMLRSMYNDFALLKTNAL